MVKPKKQLASSGKKQSNSQIKTATLQSEIKSNEEPIVIFTEKNEPLKTVTKPEPAEKP
jgi:hypothetical protein